VANRTRFVRRGSPSLKTWLGQISPAFGQDVAAGLGLFSPGLKVFGGPSDEDATILRTRGTMSISSNAPPGQSPLYQVALGVGLCTTEAAAAGAIPLPFDNPSWDGWFVYQVAGLQLFGGESTSTSLAEIVIDSKAMRKIPSGQVLFLATQMFTANGGGGTTFNFSIQLRSLLKTS